jgi:anti-sigma B factor antagonist
MFVETSPAGGRVIVAVIGRVTVDTSPHLRSVLTEAINSAPPEAVVIDFAAVRYVDTSAVATLLDAATVASKQGVCLAVIGLGGDAKVVAEATELDRIFAAMGYEVQFR